VFYQNEYAFHDQIHYQDDDYRNFQTPLIATDDPNGKSLIAKQYANISKSYIGDEFPKDISFTLAPEWTSKNVTINYEGLGIKRDWVTNGGFDSDINGWTYQTNNPSGFTLEGHSGAYGQPLGSSKFRMTGARSAGDYAYFEQNISISEEFKPGNTRFSTDYYMVWTSTFNGSFFISLIIDGVEKNQTVHLEDITDNYWHSLIIEYDPIAYGQSLPNNITLRVGVYTWEDGSISPWNEMYFDNIKCEILTKPNNPDIIKVNDNEFNQNYTSINTDYGEGYSFIDVERYRSVSDEITFTIYQNITDILDLNIDTITINSCAEKSIYTKVLGITGSNYMLGSNISWYTELSISSIPPDYASWVEIEKPSDWLFTHITDGYEAVQTESCLGTNFGLTRLKIPTDILGPGLWKFEAISKNYMSEGNLGVWNSTSFESSTRLTFGDLFRIAISLNDTISLPNTLINCSIFSPNGSVYWEESNEPTTYDVSFGNFTVGSNMTVGKYTVKVKWTNSQNFSSIEKVGYWEFEFDVWHQSVLTAVTPFFEIVTGDPLLVKAKLTDTNVNSSIAFATLKYNSTFGQSGNMVYQGSGIYLADIDTSSLDLGNYYISVNSTTDYYENQTAVNFIHINVISQALVLDVPHTVLEAMANSYALCQVNVTGAISGALIGNASISTNWQKFYNIIDHNNGTYTLNFSTSNLPTQGFIETFHISLYANKTDYGETSSFITMTIQPIQTILNANSSFINAKINEIIDIKLNYSIEGSGLLIQEANYSVLWSSLYNVIPNGQGVIIRLNTVNLSIDTYTAIVKVEKVGYETEFKTITIIVDYVAFELNPINFEDSVETLAGVTSTIIIKLIDPDTHIPIDNASVFYSWEFGIGYFNFIDNGTYELGLSIPQNIKGNYKMTVIVSKQDSVYKTTEFSFIISADLPTQSTSFPWFLLPILIAVISILGIVSLRSYVFIPYKNRRESQLLAKTQRYKDIMNIETILISGRESGIHLYSKSYSLLKNYQNELLTGFIQAITLISNEIVGEEKLEKISIKSDKLKEIEKIIELDFKHFNFFISDYKDLRCIFILKDKASERFKNAAAEFLSSLDMQLSDKLRRWDGSLEAFNSVLPPLLEKHFNLFYREKFKINPDIDFPQITKEGEFSKIGKRLLNVIVSMARVQQEFYLKDVLKSVQVKNKDKLIEALEIIIEKQIIISSVRINA
jgi:hypothetical protein